jgi:hypothetical protein
MSALMKILLSMLVFLLPFQSLADEDLDQLKRKERAYAEFEEILDKRIKQLDDRIKDWEYQLTGPRRFFYPRELGVRGMVEGWIKSDNDLKNQADLELKKIKGIREKITQQIVAIETGDPIAKISGYWEFGRVLSPQERKFLCELHLTKEWVKAKDGYKINGCHPNESFWGLEDENTIWFKNADGTITSKLKRQEGHYWKGEKEEDYWEGEYIEHKDAPVGKGPKLNHYIKKKKK